MKQRTRTTRPSTSNRPANTRRGAAFSLMEVLVALGIFTVGLVAVAAIFPTAITIQRETVREADGRRIGKNARAMVLATVRTNSIKPFQMDQPQFEMSYSHNVITPTLSTGSLAQFFFNTIGASGFNPTPVMPMIDLPELTDPAPGPAGFQRTGGGLTLDAPASFHGLMPLSVRSYPQNTNTSPSGTISGPFRRDYYWYPLLQATNLTDPAGPSFKMFLMVMHRGGSDLPPEVRMSLDLDQNKTTGNVIAFNAAGLFKDNTGTAVNNDPDGDGLPDFIQPGDQILGNDGRVHRVILANANTITVNSDNIGNPTAIYFGVTILRGANGTPAGIKREGASPVVWIEESIPLSVNP